MQVKKPVSPIEKVLGPPAPEVEYVAPPKVDENLEKKVADVLSQKKYLRPSRGRCSYCGAWEHTYQWGSDCPNFRVFQPDPFWTPPEDEATP